MSQLIMSGPAHHGLFSGRQDVDARNKPGHDGKNKYESQYSPNGRTTARSASGDTETGRPSLSV